MGKTMHRKKCGICGREFVGFTKRQVDGQYLLHIGKCKRKQNQKNKKNSLISQASQKAKGEKK